MDKNLQKGMNYPFYQAVNEEPAVNMQRLSKQPCFGIQVIAPECGYTAFKPIYALT